MEYMYTKVKGEYDTMGFIDEIKAKAKADLKTIVLPESMDKRTFEAAEKILKEGIARLVIIGTPEEIEKNGKGFDLTGAVFVDPFNDPNKQKYIDKFVELRAKNPAPATPRAIRSVRRFSFSRRSRAFIRSAASS